MNTSFRRAPWADVLYACDGGWWNAYVADVMLAVPAAELVTLNQTAARAYGLTRIGSDAGAGLPLRPGRIRQGSNSGYQAIQLAVMRGARRVILLGFDMQRTDGRSHWHGDHPRPLPNLGRLRHWRAEIEQLAGLLAARGVDLVNASRETALVGVRRLGLGAALAEASA